MKIWLLGTAAGGGFPQWNCNCRPCDAARHEPLRAKRRTQSSAAVSADGRRWFLLNASPDLLLQLEAFQALREPEKIRGSRIEGVLLTDADLDHTLGLLLMREGGPLKIHATQTVRDVLSRDLRLDAVLNSFCGAQWITPPSLPKPLLHSGGEYSGLEYFAFTTGVRAPRYANSHAELPGLSVGYCIGDAQSRRKILYMPGLELVSGDILRLACEADLLLIDGTCWADDDLQKVGAGAMSARAMGHIPMSGPQGTLVLFSSSPAKKVYVHLNNTNPVLLADSAERKAVLQRGCCIGEDGMEFEL